MSVASGTHILGGDGSGGEQSSREGVVAVPVAALFVDPHGVYANLPGGDLWDVRDLLAAVYAADAYLIAESEEADAAHGVESLFAVDLDGESRSAWTLAKQRLNSAHDRLFDAVRQLRFPCMCLTDENEWRPCPPSLCERHDHVSIPTTAPHAAQAAPDSVFAHPEVSV